MSLSKRIRIISFYSRNTCNIRDAYNIQEKVRVKMFEMCSAQSNSTAIQSKNNCNKLQHFQHE